MKTAFNRGIWGYGIMAAMVVGIAALAASRPPQALPAASDTLSIAEQQVWIAKGNRVVKATFDTLSASLKKAIQAKGIEGAVGYCQLQAYPITAIYAEAEKVRIRRASERYRNPNNAADSLERAALSRYAGKPEAELTAQVLLKDGQVHYFKPIIMQALCLNCHGEVGKQIQSASYQAIVKLYPQDRASGYQIGDLRGIWHLTFDKNK